ncbi:MAG: cytochrome-c peroxidase [Elusimicrobia bacterium GWF2_52_66]|nr:MAG: cytochrome-c peroxidase [Elusimicrobia bacterium GWF2_52_66]HAF95496.1 CusA/CzcA family heavy metal efflux RND transporter [Elusimicrobiota bacterium]HCE98808.1 CusA/CzcA family heavy metal efflux RND transporter [Elusimicrobiota bacterium]
MLINSIYFSIRHKWLILSASFIIACVGAAALRTLPIDAFPDVTSVQVEIVSVAPGKSPLEVEKLVTYQVENALRGLPGLTQLRSGSKYGISVVTVVFKDGTDLYFARQQVSERLTEAREKLGDGIEITMGPPATAMGEIYQYTLETGRDTETAVELAELRTLEDWVVSPILKSVAGVGDINSFGGYIKEYQVVALPGRMTQYGVSLKELYDAIGRNNSNVGGGLLETSGEQLLIRGLGLIKNATELGEIVVADRGGTPVLVKDLARVQEGHAVRQGASYIDGKKEAVGGVVMMLKGENSRQVVARVQEKVAEINAGTLLPASLKITPFYTRDTVINSSVRTIVKALAEGSAIVVVVLYLFLLSFRGSFVTIMALPLATLLTFLAMRYFGMTGNLMSLGGLAISIGMIIDSTIIQVENALHHLSLNRDPAHHEKSVAEAIIEVRKPSIFGELIIALTFIPILGLEGIEGKMFGPLALTVMLALFSSLLLSLTVIPALCAAALRPAPDKVSPLLGLAGRLYRPALAWSMAHRKTVLAGGAVLLAASLALVPFLGTEFVPVMDEGSFDMDTGILPGASLATSAGTAKKIEQILKGFPELVTVVSKTGWTGRAIEARGVEKTGFLGVLKPRGEWTTAKSRDELFEKMREALAVIPGVVVGFSQPIQCRIDELVAGTRSQLAIRLYGDNLDVLTRKAASIAAALGEVRGATDVALERQGGQAYVNIELNRGMISRYGLNVADINDVIETALGGKPAGVIYEGDRAFDITVRLPQTERNSLAALGKIVISAPSGARVPLSMLADIKRVEGPVQIGREFGKRRILVEANVTDRDLGGFVAEAQEKIRRSVPLPAGYYLTWGGQFENQQRAMKKLGVIVPAAILLIFLLLSMTFNSLRQATLVLLNLPLALAGGIAALFFSGQYLSVPAAVGFIALFGVAVLNGVVLVTHINQLRAKGMHMDEAIAEGCLRRMRPVLMTALITVASLTPMLFASGPGSEVQRPLAVVVIGGLLTSTLLTLLVLPTLYTYFSKGEKPS